MGQLIDLFTGKVISGPTEKPEPKDIFETLEARYAGAEPEIFKLWKTLRNGAMEPYLFGDVSNCQYRPKLTSPHLFNAPHPLPCKVAGIVSEVGIDCVKGLNEPAPWMDIKYRVLYQHIRARRGLPFKINTRSDLVACKEYIDALKGCSEVVINMIFLAKDASDEVVRILEPGAPSHKRRLAAIEKLREAGFTVNVLYAYDYMNKRSKTIFNRAVKTVKARGA